MASHLGVKSRVLRKLHAICCRHHHSLSPTAGSFCGHHPGLSAGCLSSAQQGLLPQTFSFTVPAFGSLSLPASPRFHSSVPFLSNYSTSPHSYFSSIPSQYLAPSETVTSPFLSLLPLLGSKFPRAMPVGTFVACQSLRDQDRTLATQKSISPTPDLPQAQTCTVQINHTGFPFSFLSSCLTFNQSFFPWKREWLPTPVFWPGEFHEQKSLAGYIPWGSQRVGHY